MIKICLVTDTESDARNIRRSIKIINKGNIKVLFNTLSSREIIKDLQPKIYDKYIVYCKEGREVVKNLIEEDYIMLSDNEYEIYLAKKENYNVCHVNNLFKVEEIRCEQIVHKILEIDND